MKLCLRTINIVLQAHEQVLYVLTIVIILVKAQERELPT